MRRLSIARSVQVALLGLTVALTVIAAVGVGALYASRQDYEDRLSDALGVQAGSARLLAAGVVEEATLRLTPGDGTAVARARRAYLAGLADVRSTAGSDGRSVELLARAARAQQRLRVAPRAVGSPLAARAPLAQLSARQATRIADARDDASHEARRALLAIVLGGGLALIAALALVAGLVATVRRPLDALVDAAGRLAAGDVSARVEEGDGPRELRQLAQAFNAMAADIQAARLRAETERRRLATSVRALGDALVITDAGDRVEQVNPRAEVLAPELRAGAPLIPPAPLREALEGEVEVERDGRTLAVTAAALEGAGGHVWTIRDVTERARLERMKSDFVATASHELRSPLTSIKGFVELLGAGKGLTERQREQIAIVHVSTDRLVELVDDLLDVTRLEAGQVQIQRRLTDVGALAREVGELLAARIAAKDQAFALDVPDGLPRAIVDPARLRQVLVNLLTNAHLYTSEGGRLGIALAAEADTLVLRVWDTGRGMGADEAAHAFDRFYRGGAGREPSQQGTGLGLSIVRSLVELHRGTVRIQSAPGEGTTFEVQLPRAVERDTTAPGGAVREVLLGAHVLVVEQEPALGALLEPFGVTAESARTREEVEARLPGGGFAAVVLEVVDPTGFEVLRVLRADGARRLPLVIVSRIAVRDALADEWIVDRPAHADDLADSLGAAIASARIRVLAIGEPASRAPLDAALGALAIAHEWASDADDVAAMCAGRRYEVALLAAELPAPDAALQALELRGRRLRRAVLVFSEDGTAETSPRVDAEPVAVADAGDAVLGLLAPDDADVAGTAAG